MISEECGGGGSGGGDGGKEVDKWCAMIMIEGVEGG